MKKIAFMFPGQGAQYVGMGKDFYDTYDVCKDVYEKASEVTDLNIPEICFTENEKLNQTEYTQITMLTTEIAILKLLESEGIVPTVCAGLSLGEYGALAASKVLSMEDCFLVVKERGKLMQEAYPNGGAMAAVLGLHTEKIKEICEQTEGMVTIANYNCPGQIVITGEEKAVEKAMEEMKEAGAKRCMRLQVSGPFHSQLLEEAGKELGKVLDDVTIQDIAIPYLTNVTGTYVTDVKEVKELLEKQVSSSVLWQQSVEQMIADGIDTFLEIGPGKTLSGFMRRINKECRVINIEKVEDFENFLKEWQGV